MSACNCKCNRSYKINIGYVVTGAILSLLFGFLSFLITEKSIQYGELILPPFAPPAAVFAPVWTVIYILIGVIFGIILSNNDPFKEAYKIKGLVLFGFAYLFNILWYPLFFGAGALFAAFIDIALMLLLVIYAFGFFRCISRIGAILTVPYILWLIYALYLNIGVLILN